MITSNTNLINRVITKKLPVIIQGITFEQLEQYKVYEDDQYVCYEVTDLFYTNLRQHVESIISQRSDIYFDEQVWERVENIYTYYKDRDVLASRFYYNVPVE